MFLALIIKVRKNSLAKSMCLHANREEEGVLPLLKPSLGDLPCFFPQQNHLQS